MTKANYLGSKTKEQFQELLSKLIRDYYVYILLDTSGKVFYVGKGRSHVNSAGQHRAIQHEWDAKVGNTSNCAKHIRKLWRQGKKVRYKFHFDTNNESLAFFEEQVLINRYGRKIDGGCLVNATKGGEGLSGYKLRKSTCNKMSASRKGQVLSKAWRNNISAGRLVSDKVKAHGISRRIPVMVEGKEYTHIDAAAEKLGIIANTLKYRIKAKWAGYRDFR